MERRERQDDGADDAAARRRHAALRPDAQGIILNGQNVAGTGWDLVSIRNGTWNIGFAHFAAAGVVIDTANVSGSPAFQGNDMTIIGDVRDSGANGVVLQDSGTPGTANVSLNLFRRILVMYNTGWGLSLTDTDNNQFDWVDLLSIAASGSQQGATFSAPHGAGSDNFRYLDTGGASIIIGTGYVQAWFSKLDTGNSTPAPTLQGTGTAYWQSNSGSNRSVVPNMSTNCGTGAITADIANGTSPNCRGTGAVDFQQSRSGVAQVASGIGSILLGYQNNTASGAGCDSIGYVWNNCNGNYSQAFGSYVSSMQRQGMFNWGASQLNRTGDGQAGLTVFVGMSTSTSPVRLVQDGSGAGTNVNCFDIQDYATYAFSLMLVAQDVTTAGNRQSTVYPLAMLGRDAGADSTTLTLGTPVSLAEGTTGTFATPTADTGNGCLVLTWTAPNADTCKAVARIVSAETGR